MTPSSSCCNGCRVTILLVDRVTKRPGGRSSRIRTAVLEAALAEVADRGSSRVSFESIAERAGVHKATLYRRWRSPSALLLDALLARSDTSVPVPDSGSLTEDLLEVLDSVRANLADPVGLALAVTTAAARDDEFRQGAHAFWEDRLARAGVLVERAIQRGEIRSDVDPVDVLELAIAPLFFRVLVRQEDIDAALVERVVDTLVRGLAGATAAPGAG
jgi:AcrR family transcriptional regulator